MQSIIRVSSKRQITIPVEIFRALHLQPGAKLMVKLEDGKMVISKPAQSYADLLVDALQGVYGASKEEVDEYIRKEREAWE
ncbi:MAG: AbrB/MazE/SpoVT family DNA-binding domain-containing protein [Bacillota bacterium]